MSTTKVKRVKGAKRKPSTPAVFIKVVYSNDGQGLRCAYRLLAKKVLEAKDKQCAQRFTSE